MEKEIIITPEQVKTILNWDYYENGELEIETGYSIDWDKEDNCIIASWTDKNDVFLSHKRIFHIANIFGSTEYQSYLNISDNDFYGKIADYINGYFKVNNTLSPLPF